VGQRSSRPNQIGTDEGVRIKKKSGGCRKENDIGRLKQSSFLGPRVTSDRQREKGAG